MAENGYIFVTVGYIVALIVNAKRGSGSVHVLEPVQTGKYWLVRTGPTDYLNCVWNHAFAQRPPWKKNADPVLSTFAMDLAIDFDPLYIGVNHILLCCHSIYTRFTLCQLQHWLYLGLQQSPCWLVCIRPKNHHHILVLWSLKLWVEYFSSFCVLSRCNTLPWKDYPIYSYSFLFKDVTIVFVQGGCCCCDRQIVLWKHLCLVFPFFTMYGCDALLTET